MHHNPPADSIPISALQHYLFCPRQCALIHLEQLWTENVYTAEGRQLHEKAHSNASESRGDCKTVSGLLLCSRALGLTGQADIVEFHRHGNVWQPYPVEYKRGRPKSMAADRIQLCAQALCLEEMLRVTIPEGALFYGKTRRRQVVALDDALRDETRATILAVQDLLNKGLTPAPPPLEIANNICPACSLSDACLPLAPQTSAASYLQSVLESI